MAESKEQPFKAPLRVPEGQDSPPVRLYGPACEEGMKPSPNPTPPKTGGR